MCKRLFVGRSVYLLPVPVNVFFFCILKICVWWWWWFIRAFGAYNRHTHTRATHKILKRIVQYTLKWQTRTLTTTGYKQRWWFFICAHWKHSHKFCKAAANTNQKKKIPNRTEENVYALFFGRVSLTVSFAQMCRSFVCLLLCCCFCSRCVLIANSLHIHLVRTVRCLFHTLNKPTHTHTQTHELSAEHTNFILSDLNEFSFYYICTDGYYL